MIKPHISSGDTLFFTRGVTTNFCTGVDLTKSFVYGVVYGISVPDCLWVNVTLGPACNQRVVHDRVLLVKESRQTFVRKDISPQTLWVVSDSLLQCRVVFDGESRSRALGNFVRLIGINDEMILVRPGVLKRFLDCGACSVVRE